MGARRVRGEGSIYQRASDQRWIGVIDLGFVAGKRVRRTVSAPTLKELRPRFKRLKAELAAGVLTDDATLEQWLEHWLAQVAAERNRPSTLRTYRMYVDRWIVPNIGQHRLDRLRPDHIRALYAVMKDAGKADSTRRHVHSILHRALTVAVHDGRIAANPADRVDPPSVGKGSHGKFTLAEARTVLKALDGRPDAARWAVAFLAGLRQGEALGLRWEDVDLEAGTIHVQRAAQRIVGAGIQVVPLKATSSERIIPLMSPVAYALADLKDRTGGTGFVFGHGEKIHDPKTDWKHWRAMLVAAGVPHRPLHAARATTASLLAEAGVHPKIIAEILGHAQVQVTDRHYVHGDTVMHRSAMDAAAELLALSPGSPG